MATVPRTEAGARNRYRAALQLSLSCLSKAVWQTGPNPRGDNWTLTLSEAPLRLPRRRGGPLWLEADQGFHIASDPRASKGLKVATDSYAYTVAEDEGLSRCLISWHWHPASRPDTHIHFGRGPGAWEGAWESFGRYHVPSGRVLFEDVVRFLIEDLGVTAQREDWSQVVEDVRQNVKQVWSWA